MLFAFLFFVFSGLKAQERSAVQLVSSTENSLRIQFESAAFEFIEVETPQGLMSIPLMQGASPMLIKGAPDLQKYACSYIIPKGGNPSIELLNSSYKDYKVEVAPSKGNLMRNVIPSQVPYSFGAQYDKDEFFPSVIYEAQAPHTVRDFNGQALWIYPFQYNPVTKMLRVYNSMEFEIQFDSSVRYPGSMDTQFEMIYEDLFINYDQSQRSSIDNEDGAMLIIADYEFIDPMEDFMTWKTQKGISNEIVDVATIGGQDEIKTYIEDYYNSHNLTYVLFVGDHEHIPAYSASSGYSDNYYGYIEGDDSYPEVIVGRFSAEDKSQVTTQVNRVLQYEQIPPNSDAYAKGVGVGSSEGPGDDNEYDYQHLRNIREGLLDYTYTTGYELYDGSQGGEDADGSPSASDLHVLLEDGLGIINYTGHGSTVSCASSGYSSSNVDQLTNTEVHPFFWSVACVNGNFTGTTCFAESWLRATHNGQPTGAIATLMSTINQSWSPPMEGQDEMNNILREASANSNSRSFGGISMSGCMQMNDTYGSGGADMTDTWTCFGDPSVIVRTQAPETMAVSYNPAIPVGSTSLDVSCSTDGALVSLTLDGEIIGTSVVSGGMTTVNFDALTSIADITVTVTAFNTTPEIGTTSVVVLEGPWLVVTSYELSGDEDGMFSYGESYDLHFTVENIGTEATSETYIGTTVDGPIVVSTFGDNISGIAAGESYTYTGMYFPTSMMSSAVDGDEGIVNFSMSSDEGSWASSISIPIHVPVVEVTDVDAVLSFGETTTAYLTLTNNGSAHFNGGTATLSIDGTYLSIVNDAITVEGLASGESITLAYDVSLDSDAPSSTAIDLVLAVTEGAFEQTSDVVFETPMCQSTDLDIELTIMTDTWGSETSWNFTNADGVILASVDAGTYESNSTYTAAICAAEGTTMTFNIQDSYGDGIYSPNGYWVTVCGNELAQGDSFGSGTSETFVVTCDVFIEVPGCMDPEADNYNSEANLDDGSCVYTIDCESATALQLIMADSYGDGWNGNYFEMYDLDGNQLVNTTLESGSSGTYDFCLNDGCYSIITTDAGSWTYEVSWSLVDATGAILATGLSPSSTSIALNQDCGFVNGCTDASACNYNMDANVDDGSCSYAAAYYDCDGNCISDVDGDGFCDELEIYGCTDIIASNYDPNATEEDGSCLEPVDCEGLTNVTISMLDSWGDGWNGNVLTINNQDLTIDSGSEGVGTACIDLSSECIVVTCDGGSWQSEVSWTISDGDAILLSGGAPYNGGIGDCGGTEDIYGCTDDTAINYNSEATIDDGSCQYDNSCTGLDAVVTISTVSFAYEIEWTLEDASGNIAGAGGAYDQNNASFEIDVCLEEGADYNFHMYDSYGDGWGEGAGFSIEAACGVLAEGSLEEGAADVVSFVASCDGDPCAAVDCAEGYECVNGDCILIDVETPWDVTVTGSNHTIAIDGASPIDLDGESIDIGDAIGVFYTDDNGDLQCAGYTIWTGTTTAIAAQGDDSTTDEIDGFQIGESFVYMIWDASENVIYNANATYLEDMPSQGDFVINGITGLESLTTASTVSAQEILMPEGWSNFSTYMLAPSMDMAEILSPIVDDVIIAKNNLGSAYLPEWEFNGVGDLQVGQGYQIKLLSGNLLTIEGTYMLPEENLIALTSGWNMIGYLRLEGADTEAVLAEVNATGNLVIAKDYGGNAYLPEWNFNGIGDMVPGQAYQLKINNDDELLYNSNDDEYRLASVEVIENNVSHFAKVAFTDNNMTVVIEDAAWDVLPTEGAEVAAFDKAGNIVGSAIYSSPVTVVTVWGDDATTSSKDGLEVSEAVSFKVWTSDEVRDFTVKEWTEGSSSYNVDAINVASSIETNHLIANINSTERELMKVINVLGQEVILNNDSFKGKVLFNIYNDGTVEKVVK